MSRPSGLWQGSESEEEEYHKKKKRSQSKSPSERSSSGESGEWLSGAPGTHSSGSAMLTLTDTFLPGNTERSYKKSKKHKKKAKKRRHKSVSHGKALEKPPSIESKHGSNECDSSKQASPDSDNEKKGRERDGKREKDLEKDKENDKSRGKSRSDSKQKSPKRKAAKEEVGFLPKNILFEMLWLESEGASGDLHTR